MRVLFYDCGIGTLAMQYLLAATRAAGHEARLFLDASLSRDYLAQDLPFIRWFSLTPEQTARAMLASDPEVVCFSMYSYAYAANLRLIRLLKQKRPDLVVICGGIHVTLLPEVGLREPEIDFVVVGEGERTLERLLEAIGTHGIEGAKRLPRAELPGVWNRVGDSTMDRGSSPLVRNLDELPFPEKADYYRENPGLVNLYSMMASRGCFGRCSYCNSATLNLLYRENAETYYRVRSVDNVLAELHQAVERFSPKAIAFFDDVFCVKPSWLNVFAERYKREIGLPYEIQANPYVSGPDTLRTLAESGCVAIDFGFQSANTTVRTELLRRPESNETMYEQLRLAKSLGMFTELDLIFNLPGETKAHVRETIDFVRETRPNLVNCGFLQYLPRTAMTDLAFEQGLLDEGDLARIEAGESVVSMRLVPKTAGAPQPYPYRLLPFQLFFASKLPRWLSGTLIRAMEAPVIRGLCSALAPAFLYGWRFVFSFLDRRSFFRWQQISPAVPRLKRAREQMRCRAGIRPAREA